MNTEIIYHPLIIPSIVIPFTALLAGLSALATFIAGLFGLQLKAEGPKKLLEVMLKPRVLGVALISNIVLIGGVQGYKYWTNAPVMLWRIEKKQSELARPSALSYPDSDQAVSGSAAPSPGKVEVVWTKMLGSGSFRGAILSGDAAFVGLNNGLIHEIDISNGETRREFFVGTAVSAAPHVFGGFLYAGEGQHDTHHARIYKFDLQTGRLVATYTSKGHIEGQPIAALTQDRKIILAPSGADGLAAVDADTMERIWHMTDGHVDASPLVANELVFIGTGIEKENLHGKKGSAFAYDLTSGKKIWQRELPASSWMQPIAWKDQVCFVFGEVYFPSELGGFYCFQQKDGQPGVSYNNAFPIVATPVLIGDDLVVSDLKGKICRVSLLNGLAQWCRETGEAKMAFPNPVFDPVNGVLLYPSAKEGLFILDPATGAVLTQWKPSDKETPWSRTYGPAAVTTDGWIVIDKNGLMRKLRWNVENRTAETHPQ